MQTKKYTFGTKSNLTKQCWKLKIKNKKGNQSFDASLKEVMKNV